MTVHMNQLQYAEYLKSGALPKQGPGLSCSVSCPDFKAKVDPKTESNSARKMNNTERAYGLKLLAAKEKGEVVDYRYEAMTLRLAPRTTYTPDFLVIRPSGRVEIHEVKGFMRDDAAVKLKVAAELFPWFDFFLVRKKTGGAWSINEV